MNLQKAFAAIERALALELAANGIDRDSAVNDELARIVERINERNDELDEAALAPNGATMDRREAVALLATLSVYRDWLTEMAARCATAMEIIAGANGVDASTCGDNWIPEEEYAENRQMADQAVAAFYRALGAVRAGDGAAAKRGLADFWQAQTGHIHGPEALKAILDADPEGYEVEQYKNKRRFDRILAATAEMLANRGKKSGPEDGEDKRGMEPGDLKEETRVELEQGQDEDKPPVEEREEEHDEHSVFSKHTKDFFGAIRRDKK